MEKIELEHCPFCGNNDAPKVLDQNEVNLLDEEDFDYVTHPYYAVVCSVNAKPNKGCGASSGYYQTPEEAIAAWNRRATAQEGAEK